ncbi:AAA-type ATPase family protein [Zea mays]|uniref:AAA-type ATPase family protein n=1 Tax=Zea mays TaxID=4577 RepID=A0A1D6F457_MAIZE|nr:AAA-type ATPase family protein [Zea mays]
MVDTRRSSAAKRRGPSEDSSPSPPTTQADPTTAGLPVEPASPPPSSGSRSGKRAKVAVARAEDPGAPRGKAVDPAAVDVLDSSVANLQGVARPPAANVAASSAVSNSVGALGVFRLAAPTGFTFTVGSAYSAAFVVPGRRKRNQSVRAIPTGEGTLWKPRPAGGRAEAWGRLISQSSEYPSIPIYTTHFTIGNGGKCDLKLTETSPGPLICKLKHVKRGAALEIYMNKVVHVNGKALDKAAKVTLIGGDEVMFVSLGTHAYVSFPTTSYFLLCFSEIYFPYKEIVSSLCKTVGEQSYHPSEENMTFGRHQLLKDDLKKAAISASDISESFDNFPYYLSENTKNVLLSSSYVNLCCKESTKWTKDISSLCKRVLLSGPPGSEIYQELLVKALTKSFGAKLLVIDYSLLSGGQPSKSKESKPYKKGKIIYTVYLA